MPNSILPLKQNPQREKIDFDRFRVLAPIALASRGSSFLTGEMFVALEHIVAGGLPLIGLWFWSWSANEMVTLLLASYWMAVFADSVSWLFIREQIVAESKRTEEMQYVWTVAQALREKADDYDPIYIQPYQPLTGLILDFVLGLIGTTGICLALIENSAFSHLFQTTRSYALSLSIILLSSLFRLGFLIFRRKQAVTKTGYRAGLRGVALFVIAWIAAMVGYGSVTIVTAVDGGLLVLGIAYLSGVWLARNETI